MRHSTRLPAAGFTLVEMLVIVAIIVTLLAILGPTIHKAIFLTQKTVCASNYHQISLGILDYGLDNYGYFPRVDFNDITGGIQSWDVHPDFPALFFAYVDFRMMYACPIQYKGDPPYSARIGRPITTINDVYTVTKSGGKYSIGGDLRNGATNYPQWVDNWWVPRYAPKFPAKYGGPQWLPDHGRHKRYVTKMGHENVSTIPIMSNFMAGDVITEYGNSSTVGNHHQAHLDGDRLDGNTLMFGDGHVEGHDFSELKLIYRTGYGNWY